MNAKEVLTKAVECDKAGCIMEAQSLYQQGIKLLTTIVEDEKDPTKKKVFYERIKEYINRDAQIQSLIDAQIVKGEMVAHVDIAENATGHSYSSLFGKYLDAGVREMLLEEPYLHEKFQFQNLIGLLELTVKNCANIKYIRLVTKPNTNASCKQLSNLEDIKMNISKYDILLNVRFEETLHDRKIVLSNGYIIKIGRGLHIFKPTNPFFSLGLNDYDFRQCKQTAVDIWRTKDPK